MSIDLLAGLNQPQFEAVTAGEGPILVLAGPGSGKTGVLTRRVAYLIREMQVNSFNIMAVTFTNKAANEMRHRIHGFLGERQRGLQIGTFHSTCARILRIESDFTPYNQDYVIYDSDDQRSAISTAMGELNIDTKKFSPRRVLSAINNAKNEMILPEDYVAQDYFSEIVHRVYPRYQNILRDSNAMDFDDLLLQMVLLLRNNETVREKYQNRYPFVLVDEFQDTNTVQYQLVLLFGKPQNNIFVVGDEDQSIYAFRGADYRNVMRFRQDYPQAKVILLEQNYRSTQIVLDAARAVIGKNVNRTRKQLFTTRQGGAAITVYEAHNDQYEADYIMETIEELMDSEAYNFSSFAVMYRTNAQSRALEAACRNYGVPYHLVGGISFYQRREIKDLLAYLRVVNNPEDKVSFARIINVPKRGIGDKSLKDFTGWASREGISYREALQKLVNDEKTPLSARVSKLFTQFGTQLLKWRENVEPGQLGQLFDDIVADIGFSAYLYEISDSSDQADERAENVQELRGLILRYNEDELSLTEFLQDQQLMTDEDIVSQEDDLEKITLLTLHAAKGLEYPVVFITGLEEGLLPHQRSFEDADGLEEERRLFYVGITRAKDRLYLTYAFRRALYGGYSEPTEKSGFLFDIPNNLLSSGSNTSNSSETIFRQVTQWDPQKPSPLSRLAHDTQEKDNKVDHVSNEKVRSKIVAFPGGKVENNPLKYQTGMKVEHPAFGKGIVIDSKRVDGSEIVTVAFENKKYAIKTLDAEFANMRILK
jgi:DNA helicase-2/ATP-dependent DNA helicase PcrA